MSNQFSSRGERFSRMRKFQFDSEVSTISDDASDSPPRQGVLERSLSFRQLSQRNLARQPSERLLTESEHRSSIQRPISPKPPSSRRSLQREMLERVAGPSESANVLRRQTSDRKIRYSLDSFESSSSSMDASNDSFASLRSAACPP